MSLPNPYSQYRQTQVETASHEKVIVMLHDGAIRSLQQALPALKAKDYYHQNEAINKALAILTHLRGSLRRDLGTELVQSLDALYAYLHQRLVHANIHDETAPVEEAIRHLRSHREAWAEVARLASESSGPSSGYPRPLDSEASATRDFSLAA